MLSQKCTVDIYLVLYNSCSNYNLSKLLFTFKTTHMFIFKNASGKSDCQI